MATPQSTTSGEAPKNNLEQITFRFCSECSNMLYPKEDEDSHKLMFTCRTCQYTEEATSSCVFRHVLNNAAGETAGVTQDVGSDPTVCDPVSSHSSGVACVASAAAAAENTLALCLRCGVTLLHCDQCEDPASVGEYNDYVMRNPDFAVDHALRYIRLSNYWNALDPEAQAICEDRFTSCRSFNIPHSSEESITSYLPTEMALDPEADPPEALGVECESYDISDVFD